MQTNQNQINAAFAAVIGRNGVIYKHSQLLKNKYFFVDEKYQIIVKHFCDKYFLVDGKYIITYKRCLSVFNREGIFRDLPQELENAFNHCVKIYKDMLLIDFLRISFMVFLDGLNSGRRMYWKLKNDIEVNITKAYYMALLMKNINLTDRELIIVLHYIGFRKCPNPDCNIMYVEIFCQNRKCIRELINSMATAKQ